MWVFRGALLSVLLGGCGSVAVPPPSEGDTSTGASADDGSTTTPSADETSDGGLDGSSGSSSGSSTGDDGPIPVDWCLSEHVLDMYSSMWKVRLVQLQEGAPHVAWRHPTSLSSRHWASRIDVYGESEEVLFDIERPTHAALQFGDIDGDGWTDALDLEFGESPQWFRGDPELGLALDPEPAVLPAGYGLRIITDFNGDGLADVAVGNNYYSDVAIALGDGTGSFTAVDFHNFDPSGGLQPTYLFPLQGGWEWFMVDHRLCNLCSDHGIVLASVGTDGSIEEHQRIEGIYVTRLFGSDDHDGDGVLDLLVTVFDSELERTDLVWLDSSPEGQYEITTISTKISPHVRELDVDGDHFYEMFIPTTGDGPALRRWNGNDFGPLEPILDLDLSTTSLHSDMGHGDVDGDGWTDFVSWVLTDGDTGIVTANKLWTLRPCDGG